MSKTTAPNENSVPTEVAAETDVTTTPEYLELVNTKNTIQAQYTDLVTRVNECDSNIADLRDRLSRQKEARTIFLANMSKLESEFTVVNAKLVELEATKPSN